MSLASSLVPLAAEAEETLNPLPMPAWVFGALALVVFLGLLTLTWSFRNTGVKGDQAKTRRDGSGAGLGAGTGGHS